MGVFSVPIFFIVFRETLEAAIIVSVLLGLVEQIVSDEGRSDKDADDRPPADPRLVKKLRWQIFFGTLAGFLIALAIGAAFIAVWFTQASNLWEKSENLWEGIFSLVAAVLIFVMGVTMLKMDHAKSRWKVKLQHAFDGSVVDRRTRTGKYVLFVLPFITVLREGMEAVVFVGGVSLGESARAIPIAALVGLLCGVTVGFFIYSFASRTSISVFLVVMTNFLLLIGGGLFSKAVHKFQLHAYDKLLGTQGDDAVGAGPGSYDVRGSVWQLTCCNPSTSQGWSIFSAIFGWTNSASLGTVLSYVFWWLAVVVALVAIKFHEGRTTLFGRESAAGRKRRAHREAAAGAA